MNNDNREIRINPLIKVIRTGENSLLLKSKNSRRFLKSEKQVEFIELILSNVKEWTKSEDLMMKFLDRERAAFEDLLIKLESKDFIQCRSVEETSVKNKEKQSFVVRASSSKNDLYRNIRGKNIGILYEGTMRETTE